jgi:hypothetical protein
MIDFKSIVINPNMSRNDIIDEIKNVIAQYPQKLKIVLKPNYCIDVFDTSDDPQLKEILSFDDMPANKKLVHQEFLKFGNGCIVEYTAGDMSYKGKVCGIANSMPFIGHSYIVEIIHPDSEQKNISDVYPYTHTIAAQIYTKLLN